MASASGSEKVAGFARIQAFWCGPKSGDSAYDLGVNFSAVGLRCTGSLNVLEFNKLEHETENLFDPRVATRMHEAIGD